MGDDLAEEFETMYRVGFWCVCFLHSPIFTVRNTRDILAVEYNPPERHVEELDWIDQMWLKDRRER